MEEEFYKFVNPAEIAKDLNLPKELATKIHKYWALKRKVLNERTNERMNQWMNDLDFATFSFASRHFG